MGDGTVLQSRARAALFVVGSVGLASMQDAIMKGVSGSYGFHDMTTIAGRMEQAAKAADQAEALAREAWDTYETDKNTTLISEETKAMNKVRAMRADADAKAARESANRIADDPDGDHAASAALLRPALLAPH